jgi:hypothetical protein
VHDAGSTPKKSIMVVESISYTDTPQDTNTAMIRARVITTKVECLAYCDLIQMDGGKEALEKFGIKR